MPKEFGEYTRGSNEKIISWFLRIQGCLEVGEQNPELLRATQKVIDVRNVQARQAGSPTIQLSKNAQKTFDHLKHTFDTSTPVLHDDAVRPLVGYNIRKILTKVGGELKKIGQFTKYTTKGTIEHRNILCGFTYKLLQNDNTIKDFIFDYPCSQSFESELGYAAIMFPLSTGSEFTRYAIHRIGAAKEYIYPLYLTLELIVKRDMTAIKHIASAFAYHEVAKSELTFEPGSWQTIASYTTGVAVAGGVTLMLGAPVLSFATLSAAFFVGEIVETVDLYYFLDSGEEIKQYSDYIDNFPQLHCKYEGGYRFHREFSDATVEECKNELHGEPLRTKQLLEQLCKNKNNIVHSVFEAISSLKEWDNTNEITCSNYKQCINFDSLDNIMGIVYGGAGIDPDDQ